MSKAANKIQSFTISKDDSHQFKRLDAFLVNRLPNYSRSLIKQFFEDGFITSSVDKISLKKLPPAGTKIVFHEPELKDTSLEAENILLEILYEDEYLIIINKQAGIVTHPAPGNYSGTLVNAILYHCPDLKGIGNERRPGIVHRLDKGTSGVMVIAKEQRTHKKLVELFSCHDIERYYEALSLGIKQPPETMLKSLIGRNPHNRLKMSSQVTQGKEAITHFKVLQFFRSFSHVELKLETGRTHQIRVHLSELLNAPILNDSLYSHPKEEKRRLSPKVQTLLKDYEHPLLHAKILGFTHPMTKEKLRFETPPPQIFQEILLLETQ